jgi:TolB protein
MSTLSLRQTLLALVVLLLPSSWPNQTAWAADAAPLGLFTDHADIGTPSSIGAGSAEYDPNKKVYTVFGGGENMWKSADHFHYVYKKVSGDMTIEAAIEFVGSSPAAGTPDPHRKACLVIRQSLDSDAVYADAALHGNGLAALQWRDAKGAETHEVQSVVDGPKRLRLQKRGNYVSMSIAGADDKPHPAGGAAKIELTGEFYVGLAVCAHNSGRLEKATFSNVEMSVLPPTAGRTTLLNTLEIIDVKSKDRRAVYVAMQPTRIEAPNWLPDNSNSLLFNSNGKLFKVQAELPGAAAVADRKPPEVVDLGPLNQINNDHGVSPDGKLLAISDQSQPVDGGRPSRIYVVPLAGGAPRRITEQGPSYFHGWSPDGKTLAYCAQRNKRFGIYTIAIDGGAERRLTESEGGKDDGPEFSPDGERIYFNSDRSGVMQIWRMKPDGSEPEQITKDADVESWFPHIAPNGSQMVFLAYEKGAGDHPANKDVTLRLMDLKTGNATVLAKLFGGQGTINVASWSPNSKYVAFVSYQVESE